MMLLRSLLPVILIISLAYPVSAARLYPLPDEQLSLTAEKCKGKDYRGALETAGKASQGGTKEFLLGLASFRLEAWEDAAGHFSSAADSFPLLADYSLYFRASALHRLNRFTEAIGSLQRLSRDFPNSPLSRQALFMMAEVLFDANDYKGARGAYQRFVDKFPSGADSLTATYKTALCLERLGDRIAAASSLRTIWLKYPAAPVALKAEDDLRRLAAAGIEVEPYSNAELLGRGMALYDLRKYNEAAAVFQNVSSGQSAGRSSGKYLLKRGQALFNARRYADAEQTFREILTRQIDRDLYEEAYFWLGRSLSRNKKDEEAFGTFMKLAEFSSSPRLSTKALLESAYIRKNQNRIDDALALLKKAVLSDTDSATKQGISWALGWWSFQSGDPRSAVMYLTPLTATTSSREKSLYWLGRAQSATGDETASKASFDRLLTEFPFGFYAQTYRKEMNLKGDDISLPATDLCEILPIPPGYERVKALITFGLYDEARKELAASRKKLRAKTAPLPGLARLYLEMDDFNGAYNLLRNERPQRFEKENSYQWGLCFPLAFREHVAKLAAANGLPEGLVYAVIRAESSFSPAARSPAGAVGLMQLMPATAAAMTTGTKRTFNAESLTNPETNIRYGVRHLKDLLALYHGDKILAVAAYNAGAGNVNRWRKRFGHLRTDEFVENIPFAETREYVKKVISSAEIYERLYKLGLPSSPAGSPPSEEENSESLKTET